MFPPRPPSAARGSSFARAPVDADEAIRLTDSDAVMARLSATQKGYVDDPFVKHFVPRAHLQPPRPPLINVGTYFRSTCLDDLVYQWLDLCRNESKPCQIVSFGAGSDTRYWRIAKSHYSGHLASYIELDFPEVTSKKAMAIRKSKELSAVLGAPNEINLCCGGAGIHSPTYHLLPVDLRLPPEDTFPRLLSPPNVLRLLCPSLPTLLLFECVLVYMSPPESSALIAWFVDYFSNSAKPHMPGPGNESGAILGAIVYEMFGLGDAFGQVMLNNLKARNISLPGAEPYSTLDSLKTRFAKYGFQFADAVTLRDVRRNYVEASELERISKLELLDEIEELELVLEHYAIAWAVKVPDGCGERTPWSGWTFKKRIRTNETEEY